MWIPGDWMSVSTTATRLPEDGEARRQVGGQVRLAGAAAIRVDGDDLGHGSVRSGGGDSARVAGASGAAGGQHLGPRLQLPKIVRLGDLGDLGRLSFLRRSRWRAARPGLAAGAHAPPLRRPCAERAGPGCRARRARRPTSSRLSGAKLPASTATAAAVTVPTPRRYASSKSRARFFRQAAAHPGAQHQRIERLGQIVVGAERDAARHARRSRRAR